MPKNILRKISQLRSTFKKREYVSIALLYLFLLTIFFLKTFLHDYMYGDFIAYWVPHYAYILDSLHKGSVPFWQPFSFLGVPELFKLELILFYPLTWIVLFVNYFINPQNNITFIGKSLEILQLTNLFIGAMGMYIFLRRVFSLSSIASFFGGVIFVLSIFITIQMGDISSMPGKLYLPWLGLAVINILRENSFRNYLLLVFINVIIFSLGYPYNYVYFFLAQFLLVVLFGWKKLPAFLMPYSNAVLISGLFLLPNLHILNQSFRGVLTTIDDPFLHTRYAFVPTRIVNIFNPQVFGSLYDAKDPSLLFSMGMLAWGIIPLIFLIFGIANLANKKIHVWTIILFVLGLIISMGGYLGVPVLAGTIFPFFEKFRTHAQALSLTFFSGVILCSIGIDAILKRNENKKIIFCLWQIVVILGLYISTLPFHCKECTVGVLDIVISFSRSFILLAIGLILVHLTFRHKTKIYIIIACIITIFEFSFYAQNIPYLHMPDSYEKFYSLNSLIPEKTTNDNLFRYAFTENQFIYNTSMHHIFNTQGYETVPYAAFYKLTRFSEEQQLQFMNVKYVVTNKPDKDKEIKSLRLVKTIDPKQQSNEFFFGTVGDKPYFSRQTENPYYIYKVLSYLPRFYVPHKVSTCTNSTCDKDIPKNITYTASPNISFQNPDETDVNIKVIEYNANDIVLKVISPRPTFIASSEIWDKGWSLQINNDPSTFYNVNEGFRGFKVPKGESTIKMSYYPPNLNTGITIAFLGLILLILSSKFRFIRQLKT